MQPKQPGTPRFRPVPAPRLSVNPTIDPLARWLAELDRAATDPSGQRMWDIYQSPEFATLWYAARENGERLRAKALAYLYANQAQPGGRYPDPREPAAFSQAAILKTVATQMQLSIRLRTNTYPPSLGFEAQETQTLTLTGAGAGAGAGKQPPQLTAEGVEAGGDALYDGAVGSRDGIPTGPLNTGQPLGEPQAWLATYPPDSERPPTIVVYVPSPSTPITNIHFELACTLGYIAKDYAHLLGAYAPFGISLRPNSPSATAIFHQFAIALLCLEPECSEEWDCQCNRIRARFNAPPASHEQPTDSLTLAELAREAERRQRPGNAGNERTSS